MIIQLIAYISAAYFILIVIGCFLFFFLPNRLWLIWRPLHQYRITAKIDDDMLSYYCNEDIFLLEVRQLEEDLFDITLTELPDGIGK